MSKLLATDIRRLSEHHIRTYRQQLMSNETIIRPIKKRRVDALAGYTRQPLITMITNEFEWHETADERVLGTVMIDLIDNDYGWVALARDERLRFRAIHVNASLPSAEAASAELLSTMTKAANQPDESFHQGDVDGRPVDFFTSVVDENRLHPSFQILVNEERYSPAILIMGRFPMRAFSAADVEGVRCLYDRVSACSATAVVHLLSLYG